MRRLLSWLCEFSKVVIPSEIKDLLVLFPSSQNGKGKMDCWWNKTISRTSSTKKDREKTPRPIPTEQNEETIRQSPTKRIREETSQSSLTKQDSEEFPQQDIINPPISNASSSLENLDNSILMSGYVQNYVQSINSEAKGSAALEDSYFLGSTIELGDDSFYDQVDLPIIEDYVPSNISMPTRETNLIDLSFDDSKRDKPYGDSECQLTNRSHLKEKYIDLSSDIYEAEPPKPSSIESQLTEDHILVEEYQTKSMLESKYINVVSSVSRKHKIMPQNPHLESPLSKNNKLSNSLLKHERVSLMKQAADEQTRFKASLTHKPIIYHISSSDDSEYEGKPLIIEEPDYVQNGCKNSKILDIKISNKRHNGKSRKKSKSDKSRTKGEISWQVTHKSKGYSSQHFTPSAQSQGWKITEDVRSNYSSKSIKLPNKDPLKSNGCRPSVDGQHAKFKPIPEHKSPNEIPNCKSQEWSNYAAKKPACFQHSVLQSQVASPTFTAIQTRGTPFQVETLRRSSNQPPTTLPTYSLDQLLNQISGNGKPIS
ncbi:hypothetical protein K7432_012492 [Basidiobolus ranarum]